MKTVWIVLISFVVTALIVGGCTYYLVNAKATKDKDALQAQITTLNTKVADTEKSLADAQAATTTQATQSTTTTATSETVNWKTYTNNIYGLTFKYPTEWTLDRNPVEIDTGSALSVSYSVTEAVFKVSVFSSIQSLPKLEDPAGNSNATSLANYFSSQNMTSTAVKVGTYNGFDVKHPDIGGAKYYYIENAGKVYVFRIDDDIKTTADKIFSTLQLK